MRLRVTILSAVVSFGAFFSLAASAEEGSSLILETANPEDPPVMTAPVPAPSSLLPSASEAKKKRAASAGDDAEDDQSLTTTEPAAPKTPVVETKPEEQPFPEQTAQAPIDESAEANTPAAVIAKDAAVPVTPLQPRNP